MLIPPKHHRQNLALFIVLVVASYLSAAAIAALPDLLEDVQLSQADVAEFRASLYADERQLRIDPPSSCRRTPSWRWPVRSSLR